MHVTPHISHHTISYHIKITMNSDKHLLLLLLLAVVVTLTPTVAANATNPAEPLHKPFAIFAFGDSMMDPGNNNERPTACHSNHKPYGVSFNGHIPSGRFSDGKLPMDILSSSLGIKNFVPAYADKRVTDDALLTGVSFAAGCTGLDDLTAMESNVPNMADQLRSFEEAVERIRKIVGMSEAGRLLDGSLFVVSVGTHDMMNNFYGSPLRKMLTLDGYQNLMLNNLETFLKKLVGLGAVRLAVAGLPPVGCLPADVTLRSIFTGSLERICYAEHNTDSEVYNAKLNSIIFRLQSTIPRCKFAYIDIYTPLLDMVERPTEYGFENTHEGCCGTGVMEIGLLCNENTVVCSDPSKYIFWDAGHPTEAAYSFMVQQFQTPLLRSLMN